MNELKLYIDEAIEDSTEMIQNLLPEKRYTEKQRKEISILCKPLIGLAVTCVIKRLKNK